MRTRVKERCIIEWYKGEGRWAGRGAGKGRGGRKDGVGGGEARKCAGATSDTHLQTKQEQCSLLSPTPTASLPSRNRVQSRACPPQTSTDNRSEKEKGEVKDEGEEAGPCGYSFVTPLLFIAASAITTVLMAAAVAALVPGASPSTTCSEASPPLTPPSTTDLTL